MALYPPRNPSISASDDDEVSITCEEDISPVISQLPPPLSTHHVLYFRLANHSVYRIITVPSNYDFHLVHRIIQRTFGWLDTHLQQFEVRHDCEFLKAKAKKTWMKASAGRTVYILAHKDMMLNDIPGFFRDEKRVTVEDIWRDAGTYTTGNQVVGLNYLYDFGSKRYVEVTCMGLKQLETPLNLPYVQEGKGSPSREHWNLGDEERLALNVLLRNEFNLPEFNEGDNRWKSLEGDVSLWK